MTRRGKWTLVIFAALAGLAVAIWTQRAAIAMRLFERAVAANAGLDRSAQLPDGLHGLLCGSGAPMPDADRAGPCIGVIAGRHAFVFDVGSGSVRKLLRMGFPPDKLNAVFLTHLHSDHIDGLGELLLQAWIGGGRDTPLPVYGPRGVETVVAGFNQAYTIDRGYRIAHHGPTIARPSGFGLAPLVVAEPAGNPPTAVVWDRDGVRITAIRVNHAPVRPAFGYRIDYKGRSLVLSGDTAYSPDLARAARGADVVFHEALQPRLVKVMEQTLDRRGRHDAAQIMRDIPGYHTSPEDAARVAAQANAKALVLYHLVPAVPKALEPAFLGDAAKRYPGVLKVGQDGLMVSLPAASSAVEFDQVL